MTMRALSTPSCLHTEDLIREAPLDSDGAKPRVLGWLAGASLMALGGVGLSTDGLLWLFDTTAIAVGILALPPVTDAVRERLTFHVGPASHFMLGAAALVGALALNMSGVLDGPAPYPVEARARGASFGEVELVSSEREAQRDAADKDAYLASVRTQLAAAEREAALIDDLKSAPTPYDERMLDVRAGLVSQRAAMALTPEEIALVNKLAARVAQARTAMAPGRRHAYVEDLNASLASYGASARLIGDSVIEFSGASVADAQRQETLLSLTEKERARLGISGVRFATGEAAWSADVNRPSASLKQTSAVVGEAAEEPAA